MKESLAGKIAIVTGGTAGIGRCAAGLLAEAGARLAIVARDETRLSRTCDELGDALPLRLDVRSESDMRAMADGALERFGRIDILVHCAGVLRSADAGLKRIDQAPTAEWDYVLGVNLRGTFLANRAVLPQMIRQRRGDIVNLSSMSGRRGLAFDAPYCASKFAVNGLTEVIAEEVKSSGVRVCALSPGTFDTEVWRQAGPLPRPGSLPPARRVADAILFLLSLPIEATLPSACIEPSNPMAETGWRGSSRAARPAGRAAASAG